MSVPTRARFDDKPLHLQHVIEFEEAILQLACFHDDVVSAGRTGADIVDRAWERAPAHKVTKEAIQKYADDVLKLAQSLHDEVNGGPKVAMYLQDAENPEKRVYCRIGLFDKLQVAIDQYTKMEACQPVHELQYSGIPFADRRVYGYNTPIALNMKDDDVIVVYHNRFEADTAAPPTTNESYQICIHGAEGLREVCWSSYTWCRGVQFGTFVQDFCRCKGLHADRVRFLYAGDEMHCDYTLRDMHFDAYVEYKRGAGTKIIYVLPKPEYESDPDECFVSGASEDEQEHASCAAVKMPESHRCRRPVVKMSL
jgi:hypothetical protein